MNGSGEIDNLLARIAAAKLAHAEANDQSSQLMQALETEDAAVMKVIFFSAPQPCCLNSFLVQVLDDLSAAQQQQQAIEKEILQQSTRVKAAMSELESLKASSAEMRSQLEKEAHDAELALVDLHQRLSISQRELASAQIEVGETKEIARVKAERAAAYK